MSEKKNVIKPKKKAPAKENKSFFGKAVAFIKRLPATIAAPFKNTWRELKKVTWPTRQNLLQYTLIVLVFMTFMGVVIGLFDLGATKLITAIPVK
jgi:preprotein translocase subunit SecE